MVKPIRLRILRYNLKQMIVFKNEHVKVQLAAQFSGVNRLLVTHYHTKQSYYMLLGNDGDTDFQENGMLPTKGEEALNYLAELQKQD